MCCCRGGGSHGSGRSAGHSSSHSSGHSRGHSEVGSGRGMSHGVESTSGTAPPGSSGSNGSTLRRQRASRHSQPTPPGKVEFSFVGVRLAGESLHIKTHCLFRKPSLYKYTALTKHPLGECYYMLQLPGVPGMGLTYSFLCVKNLA